MADALEKTFESNILLVTKTNIKGEITYANRHFMDIVGMNEDKLVGAPHNIVRHPDMPKIIFKLLWQNLQNKKEVHAYVKNRCADSSYYWVFANVTPSFNVNGDVIGYHSARRTPTKEALEIIKPLYAKLLRAEKTGGIKASEVLLNNILKDKGVEYDEFILSF